MQNYQDLYDLEVREFKEADSKNRKFNDNVIKPILQEVIKENYDLKTNNLYINYASNGHVLTIDIIEKNNINFSVTFNKKSGKLEKSFSATEIINIDLEKLMILEKKVKMYQYLSDKITIDVIKKIFSLYRKKQKEYKIASDKYNEATKLYNEAKNQNKINRMKILFQKVEPKIAKEKFENFKYKNPDISVVNIEVDHKDNINFQRSVINIIESSNGRKNYYANGCLISKKKAEQMFLNDYMFKNKYISCLNELPFNKQEQNSRYRSNYSSKYLRVTFQEVLNSLEPDIVAKMVNSF